MVLTEELGYICRQPGIILSNGEWLLPIYDNRGGGKAEHRGMGGNEGSVVISGDGGSHWQRYGRMVADAGTAQPTVVDRIFDEEAHSEEQNQDTHPGHPSFADVFFERGPPFLFDRYPRFFPFVAEKTPAAKAGLKDGDIIIAVNDRPLEKFPTPNMVVQQFVRDLARMRVGSKVRLTIGSLTDKHTVEVALVPWP